MGNGCFYADRLAAGYGKRPVAEGLSFHAGRGEIVTLIGPNGAGKSTILKTISGGLAPMGGELVLDGVPMERIPRKERARKLAVVFTEKLQGELMTCRDVTAAGRYPYTGRLGLLSEKDQRAVDQALELVHGTDLGDRPFDRISDGQRQRIMLARALCQEPEMILLDEPTSHLDVKYKLEFLSLLREMARKKDLSVLMSLHELDLAERISDRVVCIKDGRMDRCGTPEQVFTPGYVEGLFGMSGLTTGVLLAVVVGIVVLGGVQRIGRVTSYMVPFMAIFYIGAGLAVILLRIDQVPAALASIFTNAFSFEAVGGGVFGYAIMVAMRQGFARGVFSNEAGLGSAPMAHAASETQEPVEQGMWGVFEVFIDTIVICTLTSLAVILSGVLDVGLDSYATNGAAAVAAFNAILPGTIGGTIIQISLLFFALSTILGWSYYGERCWAYLSNNNKAVVWIFKVVFVLVCIVGATGNGTLMWDISDTLNGMMAIPNLIGLLLLSNVIIRSTNDYFKKH